MSTGWYLFDRRLIFTVSGMSAASQVPGTGFRAPRAAAAAVMAAGLVRSWGTPDGSVEWQTLQVAVSLLMLYTGILEWHAAHPGAACAAA